MATLNNAFSQVKTYIDAHNSTKANTSDLSSAVSTINTALNGKEALANKVQILDNVSTHYPSSSAMTSALALKANVSALTPINDAIAELQNGQRAMLGELTYVTRTALGASPSKSALDAVVTGFGGTVTKGKVIINDTDNNEWYYDGTNWTNLGQATVSIATNTALGIVKGDTSNYKIGIGVDGSMTVNGLESALTNKLDIATAASTYATLASVAAKLDSTTAASTYATLTALAAKLDSTTAASTYATKADTGAKGDLTTTAKGTFVAAINEVKTTANNALQAANNVDLSGYVRVTDIVSSITSSNNSDVPNVGAVKEHVQSEIGDLQAIITMFS
jgi:hypothetical protein